MHTTVRSPVHGDVRREADRMQAAEHEVGRGRFRRRRALEHTPRSEQLVLDAVAGAKQGDPDAIRFLYLRYADNVYGYVCSIVRDEHEAEDVTQLIFAKLLTALPRYEPRVVPFSAWILRVAHNASIDHVRARRSIPFAEVRSPETEDHNLAVERGHDLRAAIATLPDEQRDVIILRFIYGLTPSEIADRTGRTHDAVHGLQHRGRRALRAELTRQQSAPTTFSPSLN
jgi:RNA polymerase sigma-70 factor, ECF subfamily